MDSEDILEEITTLPGFDAPTKPFAAPSAPLSAPMVPPPVARVDLSPTEAAVLEAVERDETPIDRIILKCGLPTPAVSSTLFALELKKLIKQLPGKHYVRVS